jgi:ribonuclease Z
VAELIVLGSAASVPDAQHDTVSLLLRGPDWAILIDCGGSPLHKLAQFGVEPEDIRAAILTHHHADHIYGLPILVQGLWLDGREASLPIYGPQQALDRARKLLELFDLADREGIFPVKWHPVPLREGRHVLTLGNIQITAAPVVHADNDTLALRFEDTATGRAIVYSADTEPCPALARLAAGADLLLHEATGDHPGHSSPAEAAEVAREAGVAQLALIHYPVRGINLEAWRQRAAGFPGPVTLARDGDIHPL